MQRCRDVDDLAAALFQSLESGSADVERALCIDINDRTEAVRRKLGCGREKVARGAIDDDIDLAVMFASSIYGTLDRRIIANVRDYREALAAVLFDVLERVS